MRSHYQNPYAALGGSAAGIINSLTNTGAIKGSGYLDASKQMADIDATRAGIGQTDATTQKILQELAMSQAQSSVTPEMLVPQVSPQDWQQQGMYDQQGIYGTNPMQPGMSGPPSPIRDRPETLTDSDIENMMRAKQVISANTLSGGRGIGSIMNALNPEAAAAAAGVEGPPDLTDPYTVGKQLSKTDSLAYWKAVLKDEKAPPEALQAAMDYASKLKSDEIMELIKVINPDKLYDMENLSVPQMVKQLNDMARGSQQTGNPDPLGLFK